MKGRHEHRPRDLRNNWPDTDAGQDPYVTDKLFQTLFPEAPELHRRGIHIPARVADRFIVGWRKHSARMTLPVWSGHSFGLTILPSIAVKP